MVSVYAIPRIEQRGEPPWMMPPDVWAVVSSEIGWRKRTDVWTALRRRQRAHGGFLYITHEPAEGRARQYRLENMYPELVEAFIRRGLHG